MKIKNAIEFPPILGTSIQLSSAHDLDAIRKELDHWQKENRMQGLWNKDASLWTNHDEARWMGWLDVAKEENEIVEIEKLANEMKDKLNDIVLMGMGGSSLCPAMMASIFSKVKNFPQLHILDSTDPLQIKNLESKLDMKRTLFIVSSKSGTTLEPNIFKDYFYQQLQKVLNKTEVGDRFIAITDPGTALEKAAKQANFKHIFYGVPSIGGRYSALSNFGMVPSALMGVNIRDFLHQAELMAEACGADHSGEDNPGLVLGVILGVYARQGQNKITFVATPAIQSLGAWLEQLLAESTGKEGKGLVPIDLEPLANPDDYGQDRLFVYIRLETQADAEQDRKIEKLIEAGFMVTTINFSDRMHLGAELFRWEMATAIVGSMLGINPFNQPDVEESKILTLQLTVDYDKSHQLAEQKSFFSSQGISLFTDDINLAELKARTRDPSLQNYLQAHLSRIKQGDYVDLSAFIAMSDENMDLLQESRVLIRDHKKVATCLGFGPRFLHSTGQLYKGGANNGVFLQITADHHEDIKIPGHEYTFGLVIRAQAQADFTVLAKRGRRVLRIHLGDEVVEGLQNLQRVLQEIFIR